MGDAVRAALNSGRPRPFIVTKVGVLQGADLEDAKRREQTGSPWPGMLKLSPTAWHCLSAEYVAHGVQQSVRRLGLEPDAILLHNPEFILAEQLRRHGPAGVDVDGFYDRLADALAALASVHAGAIGVSSNPEGCRWSVSGRPNELESVRIESVFEAATRALGRPDEPRARGLLLQMPCNLLEPDGCLAPRARVRGRATAEEEAPKSEGVRGKSVAARASELGFSVITHRPIHAIPPLEAAAPLPSAARCPRSPRVASA